MNNHRLSFMRVIQNDYAASLSFLFPIVFWGFTLVQYFLDEELSLTFLLVGVAISVISFIALVLRYNTFMTVFEDGLEVPAVINDVSFFRSRGHVAYVYDFQGQKYHSRNAIQKTKRTKALRVGDQVILVVDRNKPKSAFIRDIYQ